MLNGVMKFAMESGNPYLLGPFAPVFEEITSDKLEVIGEIPKDINGVYVRNGPNQRFEPLNHYHWFDGDGMLHAVHLQNGKATYRNRWIRTDAFLKETPAQQCLYQGMMGDMLKNPEEGGHLRVKDSANTAVAFFNQHLLAGWYMCGELYKLHPLTLETLGKESFGQTLRSRVMAHVKVDEFTNEMMFFDYGPQPPYLSYGVVGSDGRVKHFTHIDLPGPRLPHDMAITENYSVLMDLPLTNDPEALKAGRAKIVFHPELPSRFAVLPRYGGPESVRWFETKPCYIYHVVNAWEEGDEVIMDCCITVNPSPQSKYKDPVKKLNAYLRLEAYMYRYHFNLKTGQSKEYALDEQHSEFPMINAHLTGRKTRFSYTQKFDLSEVLRFEGLLKYDTQKGLSDYHPYGEGRFGSESPFVARENAKEEDEGYLVTFVSDEREGASELLIIDARNLSDPPLARVKLPQRVPLGFHACWVPGERIA